MSHQLSIKDFVQHVHVGTTVLSKRSRLRLLSVRVTDHDLASRWDAPVGSANGIPDKDIVGFLGMLTHEIVEHGLSPEGHDVVEADQMESFRALLARLKAITREHGLDFQGQSGFSCRAVLAGIHTALPEFADELEIVDYDADPRNLEPAS